MSGINHRGSGQVLPACPGARRLVKPEAEFLFFIFLTSTYVQPYGYERPLVSSLPFIFAQVK